MTGNTARLQIEIRVQDDGSIKLRQVGQEAERAGQKGERAFTSMGTSLDNVTQLAGRFGQVLAALKLVDVAKDTALLAARSTTLGVVMGTVGKNAGYSTREMLAYSESLRARGIAEIKARENILRMVQANIDLEQATKLARIAQDAAVIGNINSSEAFSHLVYGIQSAQIEMLRTIGINVNFEKAYRDLADALGISTSELTEAEKAQARVNTVLEAGARIAGTYEAAMDTAGKKIGSMTRYIQDLKTEAGRTFEPVLQVGADAAAKSISTLTEGLRGLRRVAAAIGMVQSGELGFARFALMGRDELKTYLEEAETVEGLTERIENLQAKKRRALYADEKADIQENIDLLEKLRQTRINQPYAEAGLALERNYKDSWHPDEVASRRNQRTDADARGLELWAEAERKGEEAAKKAAEARIRAQQRADAELLNLEKQLNQDLAGLRLDRFDQERVEAEREYQDAVARLDEMVAAHQLSADRRADIERQLRARHLETLDKVSQDEAESWKSASDRNLQVLTEFDQQYRQVVLDETAFKVAQIEAQAKVWLEAGADEVRVAQWVAAELRQASRDAHDGIARSLDELTDSYTNSAANWADTVTTSFNSIGNAWKLTTEGMEFNWRSMLDTILNSMFQTSVVKPLLGLITSGVSAWMGGGSTSGMGTSNVNTGAISSAANSYYSTSFNDAGGYIPEHVVGYGQRSGRRYEIAEHRGEWVVNQDQMRQLRSTPVAQSAGQSIVINAPISVTVPASETGTPQETGHAVGKAAAKSLVAVVDKRFSDAGRPGGMARRQVTL